MTTIITVRHAATDYNEQRRIAGTLDIPISADGVAQAVRARVFTRGVAYEAVISSSLKRALQSAQLCTNLPIHKIDVRDECNERNYGKMQGLSPDEIERLDDDIKYVKVGKYNHSLNPPGGETLWALRSRAEAFKKYVLEQYWGKQVLTFSHYTFLQQFHGAITNTDTIECMHQDISFLEFNFFELDQVGRHEKHTRTRPITDGSESW